MSIEAIGWALRQSVGDPIAKLILISLANHQNPSTGVCYPGRALLAQVGDCCEKTVTRKLAYLEEKGWIMVEARYEDGRQTTNAYRLKMAENIAGTLSPPPPEDAGTLQSPRRDTVVPPGGDTAVPPSEPKEETRKEARAPARETSRIYSPVLPATASAFDVDRQALARRLIDPREAEEAHQGGWLGKLFDWIAKHGRKPDGHETDAIKRAAAEFWQRTKEMPPAIRRSPRIRSQNILRDIIEAQQPRSRAA